MKTQLEAVRETFDAVARLEPTLEAAGHAMVETLKSGGRILVCGNGGSAAEGQHFVTELVGRYKFNRAPLPAIWLGGDTGQMTCIANDFDWLDVFARPFEALAQPGDLLLALSTSGTSANVVRTMQVARDKGISSVALLGKPGGIAELATHALVVGDFGTARVQEAHLFFVHCLCDAIEEAFPVS